MDYSGDPIHVFRGRSMVKKTKINGRKILFLLTHFRDVIQREHKNGRFYEPEELSLIGKYFKPGDVFCDIGTNVGNHTIFVGCFLEPSRIICFEPNPDIVPVLQANILLNDLEDICDLQHLGKGLSGTKADNAGISFHPNNTGAGRLQLGSGSIPVAPGDELLGDQKVDFLKIDVEGMELEVLSGLSKTISRDKPTIFVECENANVDALTRILVDKGYGQREEWRRYPENINLLFSFGD